jgi:pimeloyl-ACP methyl ester carboxylesterase
MLPTSCEYTDAGQLRPSMSQQTRHDKYAMYYSERPRALPNGIVASRAQARCALIASRIIGAVASVFLASSTVWGNSIHPAPFEDMLCSADDVRPDRVTTLKEQIALTPSGPISYYRFGRGDPLILITGFRATLSEWNAYFLDELAKKHDVIVFDNPGTGRSTMNVADYGIDALARDTSTFLNSLGIRSAAVLGWSMGGMVAQRLALNEPTLVNHLILLSSAPPGSTSIPLPSQVEEVLSGRGKSTFDNVMGVLFPTDAAQRATKCFVKDMFKPRDYISADISLDVTGAQERLIHDWGGDESSYHELHKLHVQTLVLAGTDDKVLDPLNSKLLSLIIPHAVLIEVQSGGHAMIYQYPRLLADHINSFIGKRP